MTEEQLNAAAKAIAQAGSSQFNSHPGATLELLSDFAKKGELEAFSNVLSAHLELHPRDRRTLVSAVPAIILNQYIYIYRKRSVRAIERWRERTPAWAEAIERSVLDPVRLAALASGMADEAGSEELR